MTTSNIKPGSLVTINKSESIIDGATIKIIGWYEDKQENDVCVELFEPKPIGLYIGKWAGILAEANSSEWYEVLIGSTVYLFALTQLEPLCRTSIHEDNS